MEPMAELYRAKSAEKLQTSAAWRQIEEGFFKTGNGAAMETARPQDRRDRGGGLSRYHRANTSPGRRDAGGGRLWAGETFPYAAVDILVLLEGESPWVSLREPLAECVRLLWDAGLRLNHTVRTLPECLEFREQNLDFAISLLDLRLLAGDAASIPAVRQQVAGVRGKTWYRRLSQHLQQLTRVRHTKYQNTLHHREPDIKECPGGLRDLHLLGCAGASGRRPFTTQP